MAEIKYKYAYDEDGKLVSIDECNKETCKNHKYTCIGCGREIRPRALESKSRRPHFYHENLGDCSGETYIHNLAKKLIRDKFYKSESYFISYFVEKSCNNEACKLRNIQCSEQDVRHTVDLKQYYDTCEEEVQIKNFVADLLLTSSVNPTIPPILIEICVTHPCEQEKRDSGLKIIELTFENEDNVRSFARRASIEEDPAPIRGKKYVEFISFNKLIKEKKSSQISRFVYVPKYSNDGYITKIKCENANLKTLNESELELNLAMVHYALDCNLIIPYKWMVQNFPKRRCNLCTFYKSTRKDDSRHCVLHESKGYALHPKMEDAETCRSFYKTKIDGFIEYHNNYYIEEVKPANILINPTFRVIIAGGSSFRDYGLFEYKCNHFLSKIKEAHRIEILSGTSLNTQNMIERYAYENNMNVHPFPYQAELLAVSECIRVYKKMIKLADAAVIFTNKKAIITNKLIELVEDNHLNYKIVEY